MVFPVVKSARHLIIVAISAAGIVSFLPQAHAQTHQYSALFVQKYNQGCSDRLQKKGYAAEKAQNLCACSLKQMQLQHSQSSAIAVLTGAQFDYSKDPQLGLPTSLAKYFTPCVS